MVRHHGFSAHVHTVRCCEETLLSPDFLSHKHQCFPSYQYWKHIAPLKSASRFSGINKFVAETMSEVPLEGEPWAASLPGTMCSTLKKEFGLYLKFVRDFILGKISEFCVEYEINFS